MFTAVAKMFDLKMARAFTSKITSSDELVNVDAPLFHVVPYVTGGYQRLLHTIKTDSIPDLAEYGYHTNSEGQFEPKKDCVIGLRYKVKKILDTKGQSAVLVLAQDEFSHKAVVIKVLHSHFYQLGAQESHVLRKLAFADPLNNSHTLRLLTTVAFDSHFCLVFEPLIPQPLTAVFRSIPSNRVLSELRRVGLRLLASVGFLHQQNMIHTDLKPENILLKHENDLDSVHIVDFGNTINFIHSEVSLYYKDFEIQTPLYRAPEVMFGVPFGPEIDIWSLGCVLAELFLGKPLFLGTTKEELMEQMTSLLGPFPSKVFRRGKFYKTYRKYTTSEENKTSCTLRLLDRLQCKDVVFADLIAQMLKYSPEERLTVSKAARHPFFASHLPVAFLMPKSSESPAYPVLSLSKEVYTNSPYIPADIRRQPLSSLDLLRHGTAELPNLEDTKIVKPSPRRGTYTESKPDQYQKTNTESSDKKESQQSSKTIHSDMSVVRNFIVSEDKKNFSKNVKDKMSALLQVIREEQDHVEEDLERRNNSATDVDRTNRQSSSGALPLQHLGRQKKIPRPLPCYGKFQSSVESGIEKNASVRDRTDELKTLDEKVSHGTKHIKSVSLSSRQNFSRQQTVETDQNGSGLFSSRYGDRKSLNKSDFEARDGSPSCHGGKDRVYIQHPGSYDSDPTKTGKKIMLNVQPDTGSSPFHNTESRVQESNQDLSFISGSVHDTSLHSGCSPWYNSDSSYGDITDSGKQENYQVTQLSRSSKVKDINKLREQVGQKREKNRSQFQREMLSHQYAKELHPTSKVHFNTGPKQIFSSSKQPRLKGEMHNVEIVSPGSRSGIICMNQIASIGNVEIGFPIEAESRGSCFNRKREASERISDDEEYVELLSPIATGSNKKKVRRDRPKSVMGDDEITYREQKLSSGRSKNTEIELQSKNIGTHGSHHKSYTENQRSIERQKKRNHLQEKIDSKQVWSRKFDLQPGAQGNHLYISDRKRKLTETEPLPSVTPIKKEKNLIRVNKWELDSPEIVYKGVRGRLGSRNDAKQICSGIDGIKNENEKLQEFCNRRIACTNRLLGETDRALSQNLLKRKSCEKNTISVFDKLKHEKSNCLNEDIKGGANLSNKKSEFSFRATPDTDLKQLVSRGGYAERIAHASKKRKKARKSLAFDSQQSAPNSYPEKYESNDVDEDDDENCGFENKVDNWFENSKDPSEYRQPQISSSNLVEHLELGRRNQLFSGENKPTCVRPKFTNRDSVKIQNQHRQKQFSCTEMRLQANSRKELMRKNFDSTFTIDFESPLRDQK